MRRVIRDAVATVALFSAVAIEGTPVGSEHVEVLKRQVPALSVRAGWAYKGCYP